MPQDAETLAEAANHDARHAADFAGVSEDDVLANLLGAVDDGNESSPDERGAGSGGKAASRDAQGRFTDGSPLPKEKGATEKAKGNPQTDTDTDLDAELDRLDAERGLPDDDGNPTKKNDPEEEPETGEDPEHQAALDELRRVHGLEDADLEGLTPAQVARQLARERQRQGDLKALKDKLSEAGRSKTKPDGDGGSEPAAEADAPDTAARRTEPDDLDTLVSDFKATLEEEFADGELASKAADTFSKAVRKVSADADSRYQQIESQYDALVADVQVDRLERAYGRTFDEATREGLAAEAVLQAEVLIKRAGQDGPRDGRALMREAFDRAGREKLGEGPPTSRSSDDARANGSPSPTGRRPSTESGNVTSRVKKMDEDSFLSLTLDRLEAGDREGAGKLGRARRA